MQYFKTGATSVTLPRGKYFIGDLHLLFIMKKWNKIITDIDEYDGLVLTLKGDKFYIVQTSDMKGHYHDHQKDTCFDTKSGTLGLMNVKYSDTSERVLQYFEMTGYGIIKYFKKDFKVKYDDGVLKINNSIEIDTNINYYEESDSDECQSLNWVSDDDDNDSNDFKVGDSDVDSSSMDSAVLVDSAVEYIETLKVNEDEKTNN